MENDYQFAKDFELVRKLLLLDDTELARKVGVDLTTLFRWQKGLVFPHSESLEKFYSFVYSQGIRLNDIKAQFYQEEAGNDTIVFHGSKQGIDGSLSISKSRANKDLGSGFYCGENLSQAASFVSMLPSSSLYIVSLDTSDLRKTIFKVDREWMLAIAYYRGQLPHKENHPLLKDIIARIEGADLIIAPIADNRMFEIIGEFIDGRITDVQCQHALSATDLGNQYVIRTDKAFNATKILEHRFICESEKKVYLAMKEDISNQGIEKAKAARIAYKSQGKYLEEILS